MQHYTTFLVVGITTDEMADTPTIALGNHRQVVDGVRQIIESRRPLNPTLGKADWTIVAQFGDTTKEN